MLARFSQFFRSIGSNVRQHWPKTRAGSLLSFVALGIVAFGVLGFVSPSHASFFNELINGLFNVISQFLFILARLFIGLTIFFLKFFIEVAKYNNFIDTSTVKVGWFLVRDVANMFFVMILLAISFGTILGIEQYEWKKTLGKLILAAIFINFSNMIAQLIIDAAHVFTITFVNAISATAGGNLISMFNIDEVYKISGAENFDGDKSIKVETFAASVAVFFLAFIMMATIGAYAIVMVARMVVLWVLIILSPLAYIFQVLPQTQKYAQEWWSTFINHVIVAPVMVFFLWLSFATLGNGSADHGINLGGFEEAETATQKLSISKATSWENMANYIIAIAFLLVGLRKVRELGVEAGGLTSSVTGFAKKVGTIATGYALGRAIVDKGLDTGKKGALAVGGFGLRKLPVIGGDSLKRRGRKFAAKQRHRASRFNEWRNKGASKLEEDYNKKNKRGIGAHLKKLGSSIIESEGRKEKKVLDYEEAAERRQKITDAQYSTSSSGGGKLKQRDTPKLQEVEEKQKAKAAAKVERRRDEVGNIAAEFEVYVKEAAKADKDGSFKKQLDKNTDAASGAYMTSARGQAKVAEGIKKRKDEELARRLEQAREENGGEDLTEAQTQQVSQDFENDTSAHTDIEIETKNQIRADAKKDFRGAESKKLIKERMKDKKVRKAFRGQLTETRDKKGIKTKTKEERKELFDDALYYETERGVVATSRAEQEDIELRTRRQKEVLAARERDNKLKEQGRVTEALYERNTLSAQAKEDSEKQSVGDYKFGELRAEELIRTIQQFEKEVKKNPTDDKAKSRLAKAKQSAMDMMITNYGKGAAFGDGTRWKMMQAIGVADQSASMDTDAASINKNQANMLTIMTGEDVSFDALENPENLDEQREYLEKKLNDFKELHGDHAQAKLTQFLEVYDQSAGDGALRNAGLLRQRRNDAGEDVVELTDASTKDGRDHIEGRRESGRDAISIATTSGIGGSADSDENGAAILSSRTAVDEISAIVSKLTSNRVSGVKQYTLADLASMFTASSSSAAHIGALVAKLKTDAVDGDAMAQLGKLIKAKAESTGAYQKLGQTEEGKAKIAHLDSLMKMKKTKSGKTGDDDVEQPTPVVSADKAAEPQAGAATGDAAAEGASVVKDPGVVSQLEGIAAILKSRGVEDASPQVLDRVREMIHAKNVDMGEDHFQDADAIAEAHEAVQQEIDDEESEMGAMLSELQSIRAAIEDDASNTGVQDLLEQIKGVIGEEGDDDSGKKKGSIEMKELQKIFNKALQAQTEQLGRELKKTGVAEPVDQADLMRIARAQNRQEVDGSTESSSSEETTKNLYDKMVVKEIGEVRSAIVSQKKTNQQPIFADINIINEVRKALPADEAGRNAVLQDLEEVRKRYNEAANRGTDGSSNTT